MRILKLVITAADDGKKVKQLMRGTLQISSSLLKSLKWRDNAILLNGQSVTVAAIVHTGDELTVNIADNGESSPHIAAVDYPGYGLSDGSPDEEGCYRVVHRLYDWLIETRGFKPEDIIVVGFSIGTGPATELAATKPVGGLVLQAPCLSAPRVVTKVRILPIDPFPNLKRIGKIKCSLAVIHGTDDSIIPFAQGKELFGLAPEPKRFVAVEGADHNDLIAVLGLDEYRKLLMEIAK